MAWRISKDVLHGEIDNRVRGRVTGFLELANGGGRVVLDLAGNGQPDLAGLLFRFRNPSPTPSKVGPMDGQLSFRQTGQAGDITDSRRVKVLRVPLEVYEAMDEKDRKTAFHWANCLYLEWFSEQNGRVVIEGVGFETEIVDGPLWGG